MEVMDVITWMEGMPLILGVVVIFLSAGLEYVFPPFPGDTVTLVGAILVGTGGWPAWAVVLAIMLGSALGIVVDWYAGVWLEETKRETWLHRLLQKPATARAVEKVKKKFRDHGSYYIMINRFLPAFRSVFFLAGGMAGLKLGRVLFFGMISVVLWMALIFGLGIFLGYHIEQISQWLARYSVVVWGLIGAWVLWTVVSHFRKKGSSTDQDDAI